MPKRRTRYCRIVVERDLEGFSRGSKFDKLGIVKSNTCELFFDGVEVPQKTS